MRKQNVRSLVAVSLLILVLTVLLFVPALAQPGDDNDPLVTRSFVESRINQILGEISQLRTAINAISPGTIGNNTLPTIDRDAIVAEVMQYFEEKYGDLLRAAGAGTGATAGEVVPFHILLIPIGSSLIAEEGAEFILRGGQATAITGVDGLVDVTAGQDITNGQRIPTNHLLLVPRSDGRGFVANTDTWVMIKGGYTIVSQ